jgi:hypothetical protein
VTLRPGSQVQRADRRSLAGGTSTKENTSVIHYLKITLVDGTRFILRVTRESPLIVCGIEVNAEGDEVHQRLRIVSRNLIKKTVEMHVNPQVRHA